MIHHCETSCIVYQRLKTASGSEGVKLLNVTSTQTAGKPTCAVMVWVSFVRSSIERAKVRWLLPVLRELLTVKPLSYKGFVHATCLPALTQRDVQYTQGSHQQ